MRRAGLLPFAVVLDDRCLVRSCFSFFNAFLRSSLSQ